MSRKIKKALYPLLAAVITAAAAGVFCLFAGNAPENGSALVYFTASENEEGVVDTGVTRSVSALRKAVMSEDVLTRAGEVSGLTAKELKAAISVERLGDTSGAEITVSGLDSPEEAPIILINILNIISGSEDVPPFEVISCFDKTAAPTIPLVTVMLSTGLGGALVCFIALSLSGNEHHEAYRPIKADTDNDYHYNLSMQEYIKDACHSSVNLGALPLSAPEGLDKSGYTEAAEQLIRAGGSNKPRVIAVASDSHTPAKGISPVTKITAYLACAFAEKGHRTAVIECRLRSPETAEIFKISAHAGLTDIITGKCTVWDALAINARKGVDVISDTKGTNTSASVFTSPEYDRLIEYLSAQYDAVLLCAPKAFEGSEWQCITNRCTGIVTVCSEDDISADTAKGILGFKSGFTALCSVKKPQPDKQ